MPQVLQYSFRLFGPNRGATMKVNGHQFVNGECRINGDPSAMAFVLKVLGTYAAYAAGTPEYDAAMAAEKESEADGAGEVHEAPEVGEAAPVEGEVQSEGGEPADEEPEDGDGHAPDSGREAGVRSEGDGHEHARIPDFTEAASLKEPEEPKGEVNMPVAAAVKKLDPETDSHWTKAGLPALAAVEEALGRAGVTRKDVNAAVPDWTRDKAMEALVADL